MRAKTITQGRYTIHRTPVTSRDQTFRLELWKAGNIRPYVFAYSPRLYSDSAVPGLACSCPAWIRKRGEVRRCKHLNMIVALYGLTKAAA